MASAKVTFQHQGVPVPRKFRSLAFAAAGVVALAAAGGASAANLVSNGDFDTTTSGSGHTTGQIGYNISETDWTLASPSNSYFFVFNGSTVNSPGSPGGPLAGDGYVALYSPADAPGGGGGDFIGADPGYHNSAIEQEIHGLTVGDQYTVSFEYAGAQQVGYSGATTEGWAVTLGGATQYTGGNPNGNLSDSSEGFTGWFTDTMTFTATSSNELLSFLATGTGDGALPPFSLLDDVSVTQWCPPGVPEPATWAMMLLGIGGLGGALRMRRQQRFAAA
ncbi:MAG TPA: PEPxxWA-CTERM sorting domain-containing protein [Caulobacteraceae bacterium]|nr:PEPxxWA-CTERM sorting domain-containing protein [Caulobacteraceae bacterium]